MQSDVLSQEVAVAAQEPAEALQSLLQNTRIKLLAFGENHWWNNPHRHLLSSSILLLARHGFTHLALELGPQHQPILDSYTAGLTGRTELESSLIDAGGSLANQKSEACPGFFGLLESARNAGLSLLAIDKDKSDRFWYHPSFASEPREAYMADRIIEILQEGPDNKVAVLCGSNHIYVRPREVPPAFPSMLELVAQQLDEAGDRSASIAAVLYTDRQIAGLTFANLFAVTTGTSQPFWVSTKDCPVLSEVFLGEDRRCPWGGCSSSTADDCPGITHEICTSIPMSPISAGYWDALVFYPAGWNRVQRDWNPSMQQD